MAWVLSTVYWLLVGLANTSDVYFVRPGQHPRALIDVLSSEMLASVSWVPLSVAIFWLARRFPLGFRGPARIALVHVAGCVSVIVVRGLVIYALNPIGRFYDAPPQLGDVLVHSAFNNVFFYWLQVGVAHAVHLSRRESAQKVSAASMQAELTQAQLGLLKTQLQPHFLFNTLHSISALVHEDADAADRMIARLSELLREALHTGAAQTVSLERELRGLHPYVEIERVRFGSRLTVDLDVNDDVRGALVPHFVLQPLVENAVRHGIAPRPSPGHIRVAARRDGDVLRIDVSDDGLGLGDGPGGAAKLAPAGESHGVGLRTTRARLLRMYGPGYGLELSPTPGGGVTASLSLPFRLGGADAE